MTTIRQQAADEGGYSLSPRDTKDLYRQDGSNKNRWAVDSLIEKLDERIRESGNDVDTTSMSAAEVTSLMTKKMGKCRKITYMRGEEVQQYLMEQKNSFS